MKLENISKTYTDKNSNNVQALKDISLSFKNKGLVFINGKSGSGKTTLLNIIAGFDKPTSGQIYNGDTCIDVSDNNFLNTYRKCNIGFIAQDYHLIDDLSVFDNIVLGNVNEYKKDDEVIKSLCAKFELDNLLDKKVISLSGGERQRVAICRVILRNNNLILADEPTGNLDSKNGELVLSILKEISKEKLVIVVSHDEVSSKKYGDRIIKMKDGEIVSDSDSTCKEESLELDFVKTKSINNKHLIKYAFEFTFLKKFLFIVITLISAISFSLFSLAQSISSVDTYDVINQAVNNSDEAVFKIEKAVITKTSSGNSITSVARDREYFEKIADNYHIDNYLLQTAHDVFPFSKTQIDYAYISNSLYNFCFIDNENFLDIMKWTKQYGFIPVDDLTIGLTDYALYCIYICNNDLMLSILGKPYFEITSDNELLDIIKSFDEEKLQVLLGSEYNIRLNDKNYTDKLISDIRFNPGILLLGSKLPLDKQMLTISCCFNTGFLKELIDKNVILSKQNEVDVYSKENRYYLYKIGQFLCNVFCKYSLRERFFDNIIYFSFPIIPSKNSSNYSLNYDIKEGEIAITRDLFINYFRKDFNTQEDFYFPISLLYNGAWSQNDFIYNETFKVTSVFNLSEEQKNQLDNENAMIMSNKDYSKLATAMKTSTFGSMLVSAKDAKRIVSDNQYLKEVGAYVSDFTTYGIHFTLFTLSSFSFLTTMIWIFGIVVSLFLVILFFYLLINKRKRDIGILKSLGFSKLDINKIFMFISTIVTTSIFIVYFGLSFLLLYLGNRLTITAANSSMGWHINKAVNFFTLPWYSFLIVFGFSLLFSILSYIISSIKVNRISPIESIKSL